MKFQENKLSKGKALASTYFFMQGLGSLLPYSAVLSTLDFYNDRYPNADVNFTFPLASFSSNVIIIVLMVYVKKNYTLTFRIPTCIAINIFLLVLMPVIALLLPNTIVGLWTLFLAQFFLGGFNTITNATVVGLAGHFPSECMTSNSTGTSVSGLLGNSIRAILLGFFPYGGSILSTTIEMSLYYGISALLLLFCIFLHYKFIYSEYAAKYLPVENLPSSNLDIEKSNELLIVLHNVDDDNESERDKKMNAWEKTKDNFKELWRVTKQMKLLCFLMLVAHIQTMMLFPGVMLKKPTGLLNQAWKVVVFIAVFNFFDSIGKFTTIVRHYFGEKLLSVLVILRFVFYFTFIIQATPLRYIGPGEDLLAFLNISLFAFTNGYITSAIFILCPERAKGNDKEIAGYLALFSLLIGVAAGSILALPFRNLNPE